jgi:DNA-binding MarR family transcriptional regulator
MIRKSGSATVAELARELQIDPGAMTRLLDRLESKGCASACARPTTAASSTSR